MRLRISYFIWVSTLLWVSGCGNSPSLPPTGCDQGSAYIVVHDGALENLCGCNESQTIASSGTMLTCTVNVGATVVFHFMGGNRHQIRSTGTPQFTETPRVEKVTRVRHYGVHFDAVGTYTFEDSYSEGVSGQIIVL